MTKVYDQTIDDFWAQVGNFALDHFDKFVKLLRVAGASTVSISACTPQE